MENNIEGLLTAQIDRYSANAKLEKEDQIFDIKKNASRDSPAENEKNNVTPPVQKIFQTKKKQKSTDERPVNQDM